MRRYHGDPGTIGARFEYADDATLSARRSSTIVGVMPPGFRFLRDYPIWVPLDSTGKRASSPTINVVARLKTDIRRDAAHAELQSLQAGLAAGADANRREVALLPLRERLGWAVGEGRGTLFWIATIVLAVAVLNVGGLFVIRAAARRHDLAMRRAMGASRFGILRHLLAEGLIIALVGGLLGVLLAVWGTDVASASFRLNRSGPAVQMDGRVVSFGLLLSGLVGVVVSLLGARGAGRIDSAAIRVRTTSGSGQAGRRLPDLLLAAQIAAALVLVTGAGLLSSEYLKLRYLDVGYEPANVYEASIAGPDAYRARPELLRPEAERALARVRAVPGMLSASLRYRSAVHPAVVRAEDSAAPDGYLAVDVVDPSYFETLGMVVVEGRAFSEADVAGSAPVAVVNRASAATLWPGESALGQRIFFGDSTSIGEWATVIGIVEDVERGEMVRRHYPRVYRPLAQARIYHPFMQMHFRVAAGHAGAARASEDALRHALGRPIRAVTSHESELDAEFLSQRINALALNLFAGFALLLSAMGVYASVAYAVTGRTREVGVRVALGADKAAILTLFARHAVIVGGVGVALGFGGSLLLTRAFRAFVSATDAGDPRLFAGAALLVLLALALATLLPARRAANIDPAVALRRE
jgi:predicted permease